MYTIYHIPTIKIGCTDNVEERTAAQKFDNYEVLEEHLDIYIASDREIALQKQYGLPVDKIPYYKSVENRLKASAAGGKKNVESGWFESIKTKEHQSNAGRWGGIKSAKLGHLQKIAGIKMTV